MVARYLALFLLLFSPSAFGAESCGEIFSRLYAKLDWERMPAAKEVIERLEKELKVPGGLAPYERSYAVWLLEQAKTDKSRALLEELYRTSRAFEAKRTLRERIALILNRAKKVAKTGLSQWRYLLAVEGVQLAAEGWSRREELEGYNPIVWVKQLLSNEEVAQNMAFMANETFWMSGLSATPPGHTRSWLEIGKSLKNCAILAFVDSNVMSVAIKGETDMGRVALDTSWEMVFGSAQTQLDMSILKTFERLAVRMASSKLKLVGYAVVMAEQGVGFVGYSKATQAYERWKRGEEELPVKAEDLMLVPIFAP